jgi:hypothetical protein
MRLSSLDEVTARDQQEFSKYLLEVGEGKVLVINDLGQDTIQLKDNMCFKDNTTTSLINYVYNDFSNKNKEENYLINRSILCTKNITVDYINKEVLNMMPEQQITYFSLDTPRDEDYANMYPTDFLNSYNCSGFPPHELELKKTQLLFY